MTLDITRTLLVTKDSILKREHNLWIGYSYGNKWFTKETLSCLINFALQYTKSTLLIWIPSRLYATNLKYIEGKGRAESLKEAFQIGDERRLEIEEIKSALPINDQEKIVIANYDEILTARFIFQREILMREFSKQKEFYNRVMEISKEVLEVRGRTISKNRMEDVALYVLQELPLFLDGVNKIGDNTTYTVIVYPGLGKLDALVVQIKQNEEFKLLRENLKLGNITGIADIK